MASSEVAITIYGNVIICAPNTVFFLLFRSTIAFNLATFVAKSFKLVRFSAIEFFNGSSYRFLDTFFIRGTDTKPFHLISFPRFMMMFADFSMLSASYTLLVTFFWAKVFETAISVINKSTTSR